MNKMSSGDQDLKSSSAKTATHQTAADPADRPDTRQKCLRQGKKCAQQPNRADNGSERKVTRTHSPAQPRGEPIKIDCGRGLPKIPIPLAEPSRYRSRSTRTRPKRNIERAGDTTDERNPAKGSTAAELEHQRKPKRLYPQAKRPCDHISRGVAHSREVLRAADGCQAKCSATTVLIKKSPTTGNAPSPPINTTKVSCWVEPLSNKILHYPAQPRDSNSTSGQVFLVLRPPRGNPNSHPQSRLQTSLLDLSCLQLSDSAGCGKTASELERCCGSRQRSEKKF